MRRLLLDTHVFLWWRGDDRRLRAAARDAIATADVVFVSAATAWECAIKVALGKLTLPDTVEAGVVDSGFDKLLISFAHAAEVATLPNHHNDPFDRMLIAQARIERVALVTHDRALEPYSAEFLWV